MEIPTLTQNFSKKNTSIHLVRTQNGTNATDGKSYRSKIAKVK